MQYRERSWEGCNLDTIGSWNNDVAGLQYRERSWEGCNRSCSISRRIRTMCCNTENGRGRAAIEELEGVRAYKWIMLQYRERSWEGCNTVPLSPWGYWPQMSKLENLSDFPAFRPSAPRALFGISPSRAAESLATQGFAVFGKKLENLRPFWGSKRFSVFYSIASHASFVHLQRDAVAWRR